MIENFKIKNFEHFCEQIGIKHEFSALRTPQQTGIVKRKKVSQEIARTMLNENNLLYTFS